MSEHRTWQGVRDRLEARRLSVNNEIASYPAPITGCDAQFNHLLEERGGVNAELGRLERVICEGADAKTLNKFVDACPFLDGSGGEKQQ